MTEIPAGMITLAQAGALLMVTDHWVRDLSKKGYIPKPENGRVPMVGAVQGYIRWLKDEERRSTKTASASKVQEARAEEIQLRIAERTRELIPMEDAIASMDIVYGIMKSELIGLPTRVTRDLVWRQKIESELDGILERACDRIEETAAAFGAGLDPFTSDDEDVTGSVGRIKQNLPRKLGRPRTPRSILNPV